MSISLDTSCLPIHVAFVSRRRTSGYYKNENLFNSEAMIILKSLHSPFADDYFIVVLPSVLPALSDLSKYWSISVCVRLSISL